MKHSNAHGKEYGDNLYPMLHDIICFEYLKYKALQDQIFLEPYDFVDIERVKRRMKQLWHQIFSALFHLQQSRL